MTTLSNKTTAPELYEADFHAWCMEQAELLRAQARSFGDNRLDHENLAEEIESLGISDRRELKSRLEVLLVHLLKWRHQNQLRGRGWQATIRSQRKGIADLLGDSPSLRNLANESLQLVYERALEEAAFETGLDNSVFPASCPFGMDEVLDPTFSRTTWTTDARNRDFADNASHPGLRLLTASFHGNGTKGNGRGRE